MIEASAIRAQMGVLGSDGVLVGTVDRVIGGQLRIRAARPGARAREVPLSAVAAVDSHVHLAGPAAAAFGEENAAGHRLLPTVPNRTADSRHPGGTAYLPWIGALAGLVLLLLLFRSCTHHRAPAPPPLLTPSSDRPATHTPSLPVEAVTLPSGTVVHLAPYSLNYALERFLASDEPGPRTFTFDTLDFARGSAAIRPADRRELEVLAQILQAYPKPRITIVGYPDAQGPAPADGALGQRRAEAVVGLLGSRGVDRARLTASAGGGIDPLANNATTGGQASSVRTELVVAGH